MLTAVLSAKRANAAGYQIREACWDPFNAQMVVANSGSEMPYTIDCEMIAMRCEPSTSSGMVTAGTEKSSLRKRRRRRLRGRSGGGRRRKTGAHDQSVKPVPREPVRGTDE